MRSREECEPLHYTSSQDSIVKVYDGRIEIFNPGSLPLGLTVEKLIRGDYISKTRNKKIADVFKTAGLIEKYGSGIKRILDAFKAYDLPAPEFKETSGGFLVTVYKKDTGEVAEQVTEQVTEQVERVLSALQERPLSGSELMRKIGLLHRPTFLYRYIQPAIQGGLIEMTIPDKPQSRLQRYRLTAKGRALLEMRK